MLSEAIYCRFYLWSRSLQPIADAAAKDRRRVGTLLHFVFDLTFRPLAIKVDVYMLTPVVLPLGRASELTSPAPIISLVNPRIGIVVVAFCAARIEGGPPTKMTSTRALTSSAKNSGYQISFSRSITAQIDSEVLAFDV